MSTHAAALWAVYTPAHRHPGRITWARGRDRAVGGVLEVWAATGVRAPRRVWGVVVVANTPPAPSELALASPPFPTLSERGSRTRRSRRRLAMPLGVRDAACRAGCTLACACAVRLGACAQYGFTCVATCASAAPESP
eukprot:6213452-Pleurochrysis_carterae.AAC.1